MLVTRSARRAVARWLLAGLLVPAAAGGRAGRNLRRETRIPQVGLGALQAPDAAALALDLSQIRDTLHRPIRAVLGYSLLAGRVVQFDYPQRLIGLQCAPGR